MKLTPSRMKWLLNFYPPYIGAGVRITDIEESWQGMRVEMRLRWFNRNAVNTHFGGSLYSMVDPHLMLLMMQCLGKDYVVWDQAANIRFIKATKRPVSAEIRLSDSMLDSIKTACASGDKYLPEFVIEIRDDAGTLVAEVEKTLYVRLKPSLRNTSDLHTS